MQRLQLDRIETRPVREQAPAGVKERSTSTTARISLASNRSAGEKPDIFHGLEDEERLALDWTSNAQPLRL